MIGRIIWLAGLAALAVLTTVPQIDKQSELVPALAPSVPGPLRNFAQTQIAARAAEGNDPAAAVAEARLLVQRRPVPAEYLTLLAVAQAKAGNVEAAGLAIQIAGQRGWREPVAQEAVLRLALGAGDKAEAARRYAALFLRQNTPDALLTEFGPAVLDEPGGPGQRTMVDIVAGGERWYERFLQRGPQVMPPAAFAAITADSIKRGAEFDCEALGQSIAALRPRDAAAAGQLAAAAAKRCPA
ncbi:MAG: hypothetical protein NBV60_09950 [Erythrobacter sp.]|nr:hypothetical protein [Erythrobacter sp.]